MRTQVVTHTIAFFSHARYFEDFLKYVEYEPCMPEILHHPDDLHAVIERITKEEVEG